MSSGTGKWSTAATVLGFAAAIGLRIGAVFLFRDVIVFAFGAVSLGAVAYFVLGFCRSNLPEALKFSLVLLAGGMGWQAVEVLLGGTSGGRILFELAFGAALSVLVGWRPNRITLRIMVIFQALAILVDLVAMALSAALDQTLAFLLLYTVVHGIILVAVLRVVQNLEREHADALFEDELFS